MTEQVEPYDVTGNTIFCDDIRFEVDGKITYVGSYGNQILVHTAFPATLPKLGFGVNVSLKRDLVTPGMVLQIFMPEDPDDTPSISAPIDLGNTPEPGPDMRFASISLQLVAAPLVVKKIGDIKVRLFTNGKHYALGRLKVSQGAIPQGVGESAKSENS